MSQRKGIVLAGGSGHGLRMLGALNARRLIDKDAQRFARTIKTVGK